MSNLTGLKTFFWLSVVSAIAAGFILPFASGDAYTGLFIMLFVAPAIALTALATNIVLIVRYPADPFWKFMLACQLAIAGISAWAFFGPKDFEVNARRQRAAFEHSSDAYFAALKKMDFVDAERIFVQAGEANASDFPYEVACVAAEKSTPDELAFTIRLQHRLQNRLVPREEKPCRAIAWAIKKGDVNVARIAVENGEVFGLWALEATVSEDCCNNEKKLTEAQRVAFYELAAQYHQVPVTLMASLLATAVEQKAILMASAIVKSAGGVNGLPDKGGKAMVAAARNDWSSIEALLAFGVDINVIGENRTREQSTALVELLESGNPDSTIVAKLLERGASIKLPEGRGLLTLALSRCNVPAASLLLQHGADPNASDLLKRHYLPLRLALACIGDDRGGDTAKDLAHSLLKRGAEPNPSYQDAWHLLAEVCVKEPKRTAFDLLRKAGADINANDKEGRTALMSDFGDSPETTEKLLGCGINFNLRDRHGQTALQYMRQRKYEASANVLCANNARPRALCMALPPAAKT